MKKRFTFVYDRFENGKFIPNGYPEKYVFIHTPEEYFAKFKIEPTVHFQSDFFNKPFIDSKLSNEVDENFIYPVEQYSAVEKLLGEEKRYKKYTLFNQIKESTLNKIRKKKGKIVIFALEESRIELRSFIFLHKKLKFLGVCPSSVVYITGHNWSVIDDYHKWCDLKNEELFRDDSRIKIVNSHAQLYLKGHDLYRSSRSREDSQSPTTVGLEDVMKKEKRPHQFVCFNRRIRPPRYAMIAMLHNNNLLKNNFVSFSIETKNNIINQLNCLDTDENGKPRMDSFLRILGNTKLCKKYISYFDELLEMSPLTVDYEDLTKVMGPGHENREPYLNSYFSIVTETPFNDKTYFSTEKIYRPMLHFHPFIVQGAPFTLAKIKELGFKTFHPHIDESYDEVISPFVRMQKLTREIKRICGMSVDEMHKWYYDQLDIVVHNQNLLYRYGKEKHNLIYKLLKEIS